MSQSVSTMCNDFNEMMPYETLRHYVHSRIRVRARTHARSSRQQRYSRTIFFYSVRG